MDYTEAQIGPKLVYYGGARSLDGLHRGTNRTQRGPRSVIHYWAHRASTGATQSSYTQIQ